MNTTNSASSLQTRYSSFAWRIDRQRLASATLGAKGRIEGLPALALHHARNNARGRCAPLARPRPPRDGVARSGDAGAACRRAQRILCIAVITGKLKVQRLDI
jgi:hypothetical protein